MGSGTGCFPLYKAGMWALLTVPSPGSLQMSCDNFLHALDCAWWHYSCLVWLRHRVRSLSRLQQRESEQPLEASPLSRVSSMY